MKFKALVPLVLSLSLMVGCSGKKEDTSSSNEEIVTELNNPVEITFWHAMNGNQEKALQELANNFTNENPNITVTLQNQSSYPDLQQKITATMASPKDLPTLTQAYPDWLLNAIDENLVVDLKPYIENETIKFDNYNDIVKGFKNKNYIVEIDRKEAIKKAVLKAEKDDIILIAGKGHETYQILGTTKIHFDDREIAIEAIKELEEVK